jgi:hypothetical protein
MTDGGTTKTPTGPLTWNQQVGQILALQMKTQLTDSIVRMAPRYLVQQRAKGALGVTSTDLIASRPIDLFTAKLLCNPQVMQSNGTNTGRRKTKGKGGTADPSLFADGVRVLQDWEWLGAKDPTLWGYCTRGLPAPSSDDKSSKFIPHAWPSAMVLDHFLVAILACEGRSASPTQKKWQ